MKFMKKVLIILLTIMIATSTGLPAQAANQTVSKPSKPQGITDELHTSAPGQSNLYPRWIMVEMLMIRR